MSETLSKVIGIGASAGGLRALESFFDAAPPDAGFAYIVIQHLSPDFKSLMDDLLSRHTVMPIHRAEENLAIQPDSIYLIPPKKTMTLIGGRLHLSERTVDKGLEFPINIFFKSLAEDQGARSVGVVLSGTGSDGSEGIRAIYRAGGLVIAQNLQSASFDGMPRSAISTDCCHYILPPERMPQVILENSHEGSTLPNPHSGHGDGEDVGSEGEMGPIIHALYKAYGIDFSLYKEATVYRRIQRRMSFLNMRDPLTYGDYLVENESEVDSLYRDLLIGVTEFFRDPEVFEYLEGEVLPKIVNEAGKEIRIWITGCATGEEVYSLAIALDETIQKANWFGKVNIFATDVHRRSLNFASAGIYPESSLSHVSEQRRKHYFTDEGSGMYKIRASVRQGIVFAPHNVIVDPPFTRMNLVSCRNLLIYLKPRVQEKVIRLFNYALVREGYLLLGTSEGLSRLENDFYKVESRHKIFKKREESRGLPELQNVRSERPSRVAASVEATPPRHSASIDANLLRSYDHILNGYVHPGLIINEGREVLHYFGDVQQYLKPERGRAEKDVLKRVDGELQLVLSTLIQQAMRMEEMVRSRGVRVGGAEGDLVNIQVDPISLGKDRGYNYFIVFEKVHAQVRPSRGGEPSGKENAADYEILEVARDRIVELENELVLTKENLQATVEELQTSNEELQATNEELLASNEELQSTNEELHSVNEELYTVNAEYERKNNELLLLNQDHDNLLSSLEAGIVFLDKDLQIRKFNPAISTIFKILPQDIGRPIEHIAYQLEDQERMLESVRHVLATGERHEKEVRTRSGQWMLKRIQAFYGVDDCIEGVVLSFMDISELKSLEKRLSLAMRTARLVWWDWNLSSGELKTHSQDWCILGYNLASLAPRAQTWHELVHPDDRTEVMTTLDSYLEGKTGEWNCVHRFKARDGQWRWVRNVGTVIDRDEDGKPLRMIGTTQDISEYKALEAQLTRSQSLEERALAGLFDALIIALRDDTIDGSGWRVCKRVIERGAALGFAPLDNGDELTQLHPAFATAAFQAAIARVNDAGHSGALTLNLPMAGSAGDYTAQIRIFGQGGQLSLALTVM